MIMKNTWPRVEYMPTGSKKDIINAAFPQVRGEYVNKRLKD